ncbi:MAG: hypothetical protein HRT71_18615 [Flavobacteriales bacterium]|nr:hypothetical protein [Flavobacteriales bacterium]
MGDPHEHDVKLSEVDKKLAKGDYVIGSCDHVAMTKSVEKDKNVVVVNGDEITLSAYPNPFRDETTIVINKDGVAEQVQVELYQLAIKSAHKSVKKKFIICYA